VALNHKIKKNKKNPDFDERTLVLRKATLKVLALVY
jgi:hypothetical protein